MKARRPDKPIRVFYSDLSGRFFATKHWKEKPNPDGKTALIEITGKKYDVTQDVASAVVRYDLEFVRVDEQDGDET